MCTKISQFKNHSAYDSSRTNLLFSFIHIYFQIEKSPYHVASAKPPYYSKVRQKIRMIFLQRVFEMTIIQTMLPYEVDSRNYDHHDGISPQNCTAEALLMNYKSTMKRHHR
jgi:hypothetical protein